MLEIRTCKGNTIELNTIYEQFRLFDFLTGRAESIYVGGAYLVSPYSSLSRLIEFSNGNKPKNLSEIKFFISDTYNDDIRDMEEDSIIIKEYTDSLMKQLSVSDTVSYENRGEYICHYFDDKIVGTVKISKDFNAEYTLIRNDNRWVINQVELLLQPNEKFIGTDENGHNVYEYSFADIIKPIKVISDANDENFFSVQENLE